ncbi:hypothetical protein L226DRAFT_617905 [Lentinus tigrinus ALCF2SS1-7]|uniref:uncharacterized protein n=1 Tax=Lentinus tigrinus ALCF2SS1-7 TaxID=1328758 RepID=UPI00116600EA|nr:hypothetical protein L226DRAFT_617905 [Lentinus tigrinus ALCF2SS1-7]
MGLVREGVSVDLTNPWNSCFCLAFVGSQLFRRHETYAISYHTTVLLLPLGLYMYLKHFNQAADVFTLVFYYAAYPTCLVFWTILYRISPLHPLAHHPGPFWCKTSKIWWGLLTLRGYSHHRLGALHERT